MSRYASRSGRLGVLGEMLVDAVGFLGSILVGCLAIALLSLWHRFTSLVTGGPARAASSGDDDADVVEYELGWYHYLKAMDAHHGPGGSPDRSIDSGSALRGLGVWIGTRFLRGYTLGDEVYVCSNAPQVVRVHQLGHAPSFGSEFPTLVYDRRESGGLEDAPLRTFDVMLPGDFPHTFLRLRDPRGLTDAYERWLQAGRLQRVA